MKSRVINTKHLEKLPDGSYLGYTSNLKPSLFYGYAIREGVTWIQFMDRGSKMARYVINEDRTDQTEKGELIWIYEPDEKSIKRFPDLAGTYFKVIFDQINTRKWKNQKVKDKWLYGKKPSQKHIEFKKKMHERRMKRKARRIELQARREENKRTETADKSSEFHGSRKETHRPASAGNKSNK